MNTFVVIDDDEHLAIGISDILELDYEGCRVFKAYDGVAGYELIVQHKPDLIICNYMMPKLDGRGVLKRLHENEELKAIPFILESAARKSGVYWLAEFGLDVDKHFLLRPFDAEEMLVMVQTLLDERDTSEA